MDRVGALVVLVATATANAARADGPITSRDYAIEIYDGVAIGNTAQVGMGGAGAALVIGTAGTLINASAPAVRQTTDTDAWSWDYHLDYLTGALSSDYDNNGIITEEGTGASLFTAGFGVRVHDWAGAITATGQSAPLDSPFGLQALNLRLRVAVAKWFPSIDTSIGLGVQSVLFGISSNDGLMFGVSGTGAIAGATYAPRSQNVRLALATESKILGGKVDDDLRCDPQNCMGYILPEQIEASWRTIIGGAYRWAPTQWNQLVAGPFRDERSLTVAADVVITGSTTDGHSVEAFALQQLQRSGRHVALSVRGGAEYEWLPGRLRLRAGSYWEPSRFERLTGYRDTGGRLHATFGAEVRVFAFNLWGPRRGRLSFTGDVAPRYRNIAVSIGFWH
ncbi:MAG: hypothetical protein AB7P03_04110 [Kofleriaceae bacterium]